MLIVNTQKNNIMSQDELIKEYLKIESKVLPIKDFIESNKDDEKYKGLYKGFITLQSPLILNPDILFIGINSGDGAFVENQKLGNKETIRVFNPESKIDLDWYKVGVARGEMQGKNWKAYHWYQRDKKINNIFPQRMIDLLYKIAEIRFGKDENRSMLQEPLWFKSFGQKIMYTNLYPIATTNTVDLKKIFGYLIKEPEIKSLLEKQNGLKEWDIQKFFITEIKSLVNLVQPKAIVCMGTKAFDDFTNTNKKKVKKVFKLDKENRTVIGFSRKGNWCGLIPELAKEIADKLELK